MDNYVMMKFQEWMSLQETPARLDMSGTRSGEMDPAEDTEALMNLRRVIAQLGPASEVVKNVYRQLMDARPHLMPQVRQIIAAAQQQAAGSDDDGSMGNILAKRMQQQQQVANPRPVPQANMGQFPKA